MTENTVAVVEEYVPAPMTAMEKEDALRAQIYALKNPGTTVASSFPITDSNSLKVFELIGSAEPLEEHVDEPFELAHYVAQIVDFTTDNGELEKGIRIVLVTKDLKGYSTMSDVVRSDLQTLIGLRGEPNEWQSPVWLKAVKEKSNKKREFLTLRVAIKEK